VKQEYFCTKVRKDPRIQNAYLLVHSDRYGIHLNIAEGSTNGAPADPQQPYFIASVGKLITSVVVGLLKKATRTQWISGMFEVALTGIKPVFHFRQIPSHSARRDAESCNHSPPRADAPLAKHKTFVGNFRSSPNGNRTRISALRGLRPKPLDDRAITWKIEDCRWKIEKPSSARSS
jgi:hypothetical protein